MRSFSFVVLLLIASLSAENRSVHKSHKHAPKHQKVANQPTTTFPRENPSPITATAYIDNRAAAGCTNTFNCSSLTSLLGLQTMPVVSAELKYHRNYTHEHLATSITKLTALIGEIDTTLSDIPFVTLTGACFSVDKEITAATSVLTLYYIQFVVKSGQFLTLKANHLVTLSGIYFYGLPDTTINAPLISATAGSLSITDSVFQRITLSGASLLSLSGISSFTSSDSTYKHISTTSSGAVLSLTVSTDCSLTFDDEIKDCSTTANGGAFSITIQRDHTLTLNALPAVSDCTAGGKGGMLYMDIQGSLDYDSEFMYAQDCIASEGTLFYITTSQTGVVETFKEILKTIFLDDAGEYEAHSNYAFVELTGTNAKKYKVIDLVDPYYILAKGENGAACTTGGHKCATITALVALIQTEPQPSNLIVLNKGTHEKEAAQIEIAGVSLYITGATSSASETVMALSKYDDNGECFVISSSVYFEAIKFEIDATNGWSGGFLVTSYVTFTNCQFAKASTSTVALSASLFTVQSSLELDSTTISGLTLSDKPLIQITSIPSEYGQYGSSIDVRFEPGTVISDITRNDGNGAVMEYDGSSYMSVQSVGTTFKNCKAKGNGGALYLSGSMCSLYFQSYEKDYRDGTDRTNKFEGCQAGYTTGVQSNADSYGGAVYFDGSYTTIADVTFTSNTATKGSSIYIIASSVSYLSSYFLSWTSPNSEANKYVAKIGDDESDVYSLIPITYYVSGASTATDTNDCTSTRPCKTLDHVYESFDGFYVVSLDANTHAAEENSVSISGTLKGKGTDKTIKLVTDVGIAKEVCYSTNSDLSVEQLTFRIVSNANGAEFSVPVMSFASLTLTTVTFEMVGHTDSPTKISPLASHLLSVYSTLTLDNIAFKDFVLKEKSLLDLSSYCTVIVSLRSSFTNIRRQSGDGAVFEVTFSPHSTTRTNGGSDQPFTLSNLDFDTCVCENGNGGAVSITIGSSSVGLTVSSLNFKNCKAAIKTAEENAHSNTGSGAKSMGGAMFLLLQRSPSFYSFSVSGIVATGCSADSGSAFFAGSTSQDLLFDPHLWDGLLSGETAANEFVLGALIAGNDGSYTLDGDHTKQVSEVSPYVPPANGGDDGNDGGFPTWAIIVIVIGAVVIIGAVVAVILLYFLKSKGSSKVDPKDSSEAGSATTEMQPSSQEESKATEENQEQ